MEHKKMMKTAAIIDKILKFLQVALVVAGCLLLIAGACMVIFKDTIVAHSEYISDSISFGELTLSTAHGSALSDSSLLAKSQLVTCVLCAILGVIAWYGIRLLRQIVNPMKNGEPFYAGISGNLRKLAIFVVVGGVVDQIFTRIAYSVMLNAYDIGKLLNTQVVEKYTLNFTLDFSFVAVAAILFLLAYVFRYGEELQRESDETL